MDAGAIDLLALFVTIVIALVITVALFFAQRGSQRRAWIIVSAIAVLLLALGLADLLRENPRQTHLATVFVGATMPVLGAFGLVRATAPMRPRFRWPFIFVSALVLLFGALLLGATVVPRYL